MAEQMFSGLLAGFKSGVQTIGHVVAIHDHARDLYYGVALPPERSASDASPVNDAWSQVRVTNLKKPEWLVYDHCAAITRLYALYETFIEDLVSEYLGALPGLYLSYQDLPASILKQHRLGCGQVLLKMGESGPFRLIPEDEMDARLLGRSGGGDPYSLVKEAFFVDRQNYRAEPLARLFSYLGITALSHRVAHHQLMAEFLRERRPETTYKAELNQFVGRRNEAAHGSVDEALGTDETTFLVDFLTVLSQVLASIAGIETVQRRLVLGQMVELGIIEQIRYRGRVLIARMRPIPVSVGDSIVVGDAKQRELATIDSIQDEGRNCATFLPTEGKLLGLGLGWRIRAKVGYILYKFPVEPETPRLFAEEEAPSAVSADSDREQIPEGETPEDERDDPEGGGVP